MAKYRVDCGDWGEATVEAETRSKAAYMAFRKWNEAYRPDLKHRFMYFIKCVVKRISRVEAANE